MTSRPHRRHNPLTGDWVIVSPQRSLRPWQGSRERVVASARPSYLPDCYLCPGNPRASGETNPEYTDCFVFTNDFPALEPEVGAPTGSGSPLLEAGAAGGTCRVVCFSPDHSLTLPEMSPAAIGRVLDTWAAQVEELGERYRWVQVFENKGAAMGCSNPHPHGQIWATEFLPNETVREDNQQRTWRAGRGTRLLADYAALEAERGERVVVANGEWLAVVPWWATWPFETLILPRRELLRLPDLDVAQREALADLLKRLLTRYDNLFETSFPYAMGWHGAPSGSDVDHWQLHAHIYPPLLRSATVRKFMVGFEMLAEAQRDLTPEQAAERLRGLSERHYLEAGS